MSSDPQGEFNITDLSPGYFELTISYLGFLPFTKSVMVTAGQNTRVDAVLKVASAKTEITVYADRQLKAEPR